MKSRANITQAQASVGDQIGSLTVGGEKIPTLAGQRLFFFFNNK
jgi:hypothetical protein